MNIRQSLAIACGALLIAGATVAAGQTTIAASGNPDGLVEVKSQRFDQVYLRPGTDFRVYKKIMLDPTQVSFASSWLKDMNFHKIAVLQGTTAADAERIAQDVNSSLRDAFAGTFSSAGYEVVAAPGPNVLGLSVQVVDLYINAPDTVTHALPSRVYTRDAGRATLALEVRDSTTGVLLARVVDRQTAGVRGGPRPSVRITTSSSNKFDFESMFDVWARYSIEELRAPTPVAMNAPAAVRQP